MRGLFLVLWLVQPVGLVLVLLVFGNLPPPYFPAPEVPSLDVYGVLDGGEGRYHGFVFHANLMRTSCELLSLKSGSTCAMMLLCVVGWLTYCA